MKHLIVALAAMLALVSAWASAQDSDQQEAFLRHITDARSGDVPFDVAVSTFDFFALHPDRQEALLRHIADTRSGDPAPFDVAAPAFDFFALHPDHQEAYLRYIVNARSGYPAPFDAAAPAFDFFALHPDQQAAYLRQIADWPSHSTPIVVTIHQQASARYSARYEDSAAFIGSGIGFVTCYDYAALAPHMGSWERPRQPSVQWVKAKGRARCRYVHTSSSEPPPPIMEYTLVLMLFERGGPAVGGQFHQEGMPSTNEVAWQSDADDHVGTQATAGKCENGTYRNALALFVQPPPGYTYYGPPQPFVTDFSTSEIGNCP